MFPLREDKGSPERQNGKGPERQESRVRIVEKREDHPAPTGPRKLGFGVLRSLRQTREVLDENSIPDANIRWYAKLDRIDYNTVQELQDNYDEFGITVDTFISLLLTWQRDTSGKVTADAKMLIEYLLKHNFP